MQPLVLIFPEQKGLRSECVCAYAPLPYRKDVYVPFVA